MYREIYRIIAWFPLKNTTRTADNVMMLSVIIPTYNESRNIVLLIDSIRQNLPSDLGAEIVVVDDNSPDRTDTIVRQYADSLTSKVCPVRLISRPTKSGLSSAILAGVQSAAGDIVVVMDGDFSHPPQIIPKMVDELEKGSCDIVIASRYIRGGSVMGWPFKRRLMSRGATRIAQYGLGIREVKDPMSGFFAFRRRVIEGLAFDAIGYKILLEILVKREGVKVKEIPYTFTNRKSGSSKLNASVVIQYVRAVWRLYRFGRTFRDKESRVSVRFLAKAGRFYTVGAVGLLINYLVSLLSGRVLPDLWYLHASVFGIVVSMTSNFFLNKAWTFEDRDFSKRKTLTQFGLFSGFSTVGALLQLAVLYALFDTYRLYFPAALIMAVVAGAVGNFLLNKKWTFKERIWS